MLPSRVALVYGSATMKRGIAGLVVVAALLNAGCGAELTAAGAAVRVEKGVPQGFRCKELGIVYGSGGGGAYTSAESKLQDAQKELRNKTAELGGNYVIMDASAGDLTSISMSGRALSCEAEAEEEAEAPPGAVPVKAAAPEQAAQPVAATAPAAPAPAPAQTPEQRIRTLDDLHQKGLVTDAEYQQRRKEILDSI